MEEYLFLSMKCIHQKLDFQSKSIYLEKEILFNDEQFRNAHWPMKVTYGIDNSFNFKHDEKDSALILVTVDEIVIFSNDVHP